MLILLLLSVPAGDEGAHAATRARPQARRQRGVVVRLLPAAALEARRRGAQPAPLHLGGK